MIKRDTLINFINKTLGLEQDKDKDPYLFNGLHVEGKENINKIALSVSSNADLYERAVKWGADMIILHHGMFGPKKNAPITNVLKKRLKILLENNINLLGYHLYLDQHQTLGNNAQIIKLLGAKRSKEFGYMEKLYWGWEGSFSKPVTIDQLEKKCRKLCGASVKVYPYGKKTIKNFGMVSGGAPYILIEAINKNLDAYITGEPAEFTKYWTKDADINFITLGHYNSEKFGVIALGKAIKKKYPALEIKFIDVPNLL